MLAAARDREARPAPRPAAPARGDGYRPGACNIGDEEIARRRRSGHAALAVGIAVFIVLLAIGAPRESRLILFIPAAGSAIGYLQAGARFCAAFGLLGVFNFGPLGGTSRITDPEAVGRDRRRAMALIAASAVVGLGVALAAMLI